MYVWKPLSPSQPQYLEIGVAFGMTDVGSVRPSNEDNFLIDVELGLVAVADGMGGHAAGEIASADALVSVRHYLRAIAAGDAEFQPEPRLLPFELATGDAGTHWTDENADSMMTLNDAVAFANERMFKTNMDNKEAEGGGMGTTLTGFWQAAPGSPLSVFHVGDSRLYRMRDGNLTQLTRDQTMHQHALELGLRHNLPPRNFLMQALGPSHAVHPDLQTRATEPGDIYLLCSDGLHGCSSKDAIAAILSRAVASDLGSTCASLIEQAKQDGSRDNITVVVLMCL